MGKRGAGMKRYEIWLTAGDLKGKLKSFPFRFMAVIWCILHGYVVDFGKLGLVYDKRIEIIEVN